jgi:hemerythrin-like domain-containing protein
MEGKSALRELSRQHSVDRQKCGQIMHTIRKNGDKELIRREIMNFWNSNLKKHVEAEETVLIPFLAKHHFNNEFINVLVREHNTIRLLAERIPLHDDGYYLYRAFIHLVEQHTSFEEEVVFRKMELHFSPVELSRLDATIEARIR